MKLIKNILAVLVPLTLFSGTAFSQTKEELKKNMKTAYQFLLCIGLSRQ
ncbi:hypothetical protein IQ31_02065 [Sphingobacterium siyangense]|uniref:Uncharacterized protein n=1 Tax=Sphingobacterium siyangense TaxID=459529 RepID=A0A562ML90_9SPHI|nr:hypothetical protein IQ31_02065 [Sphingobacterium siyangense]